MLLVTTKTKTPVIICGALGRMGRACIELGLSMPDEITINGATVRSGTSLSALPKDWGFPVREELDFSGPQVLIDFSKSELIYNNLKQAIKYNWPILIGTTGHSDKNLEFIKQASNHIAVLYAPNTSIFANLLINLSKIIAKINNLEAHILDIHHRDKKDAPSGTALAIQKAIATHMMPENISISSLRIGDVVGEHTVSFFKKNERLELSHKVTNRQIFAEGALIAAQFLSGRAPGLYDMSDVLNLK